ncbi:putative endoribonuclease L-PSP [metagenome]|uniref:Putative endoribonuclease L-PSP n=1 Tax=metagenome TaxID=256318 RepID=A0A2P2C290_9ZZZZ
MSRRTYEVLGAPAPGGPYSANARVGRFVAVAGQCGYLPDRTLAVGVAAQTRVALHNLLAALEAAGAVETDIIATGVFLADGDDFDAMNEVYREFFSHPWPPRTTVVAGLRPGVLFEINATAVADEEG